MAANALSVQLNAARATGEGPHVVHYRNVLLSLVNCAAVTNESIKLIRESRATLDALAQEGKVRPEVVADIDLLCSWTHPANTTLKRARHDLGFHWKPDVIAESVKEYAANERVVWLELASDGAFVHRLAVEVLAHALLGTEVMKGDPKEMGALIADRMGHVWNAMKSIEGFLSACVIGFFVRHDIAGRSRSK